MKYLLDTNAVAALMKGEPAVLDRLEQVSRAEIGISQPVLAEIAYGLKRLPRSKRRSALEERFEVIRAELPRAEWTDQVSEIFGRIKADLEKRGQAIEDFDAAIGAHALATGAVLVTANLSHMLRISGLRVEDWASGAKVR